MNYVSTPLPSVVPRLRYLWGTDGGGGAQVYKLLTLCDWDLRVVAKRPDKRISLIRLAKDKKRVAFRPDHLAVVDLSAAELNVADTTKQAPGVR